MNIQHTRLIAAMVRYDRGDARRIQHFMKVHDFAAAIGKSEKLSENTLFVLETAAIVHDIGIHLSEEKYGSCDGKYQELEGPAEAEKLLLQVGGYTAEQIARVCWLIAHHHTYTNMDAPDYQILVEADFLVNLYEKNSDMDTIRSVRERIFKTEYGTTLLCDMFGL